MKSILKLLPALFLIIISGASMVSAQTVILYQNAFDSPLSPPVSNCGPDVSITPVNTLWGGTGLGTGGGGLFMQQFTVETILINGTDNQYTDPLGTGGDYCLGMYSSNQDDKLALTLNSQMIPFINLSFIMSPIDLAGCTGPFGPETAVMRLTVYDSPGGTFSFSPSNTILDTDTITGGEPGPTPYTFNWSNNSTSFDVSNSIDGNITIVFDLIEGVYAAIDNIVITSSTTPICDSGPQVIAESGDVYIDDACYGVILTAPNGICFRLRVQEDGSFISEPVSCPQ